MTISIVIFATLSAILFMINLRNGKHWDGLTNSIKQLLTALPIILLAILLAGFIEMLIPDQLIKQLLSPEAGLTGVFIGTFGGMLMALGPYAAYPIIASIYHAGAGLGTTISLLAGWTFLGLGKVPFESSFLGLRFTVLRMLLCLPLCLLAGIIAHIIDRLFL